MFLNTKLQSGDKPIKVAFIGCGKFVRFYVFSLNLNIYRYKYMFRKIKRFYRQHIFKDEHTITLSQWFMNKGDEKLRFNYPFGLIED